MEWAHLLVIEPISVLAYLVFGMVGFGSTLVSAPVLAHLLPVSTVVPAMALTDFIGTTANGLRLSANLVRIEVWRLAPGMLLGSGLGTWILLAVPVSTLMLLLGLFVVGYAIYGLGRRGAERRVSPHWSWLYGACGGVLSALFGAGGWVYSLYLTGRMQDPRQVLATQSAVLILSSSIRVTLFAIAGRYFEKPILWLVLALLPAMVIGLYLGHRINLKIDRQRFMKVLYSVLLLTGSSLILRSIFGA
jgi:uncharacterized membrane protein YfcA